MNRLFPAIGLLCLASAAHSQEMPAALRGEWRITKILPTKNTQCWGDDQTRPLLNSTIRYTAGQIFFKHEPYAVSEALTRTLSARKFHDEYKLDLTDLGIRAPAVTEIDLQHDDADITGATTEVPGDTVLLAGPGRIVISACGVYFSAVKVPGR